MRSDAIYRIGIWSIILVILTGILFGSLTVRSISRKPESETAEIAAAASPTAPDIVLATEEPSLPSDKPTKPKPTASESAASSQPSSEVPAVSEPEPFTMPEDTYTGSVRKITIRWAYGSVKIAAADVPEIQVSDNDTAGNPLKGIICGDLLTIDFCDVTANPLGFSKAQPKDLTVLIPYGWIGNTIDVDLAASTLSAEHIAVQDFRIESTAGTCDFRECRVAGLSISTADGDVTYTGTLDRLNMSSTSASVNAEIRNAPSSLTMQSSSGSLRLYLREKVGFTAALNSLNGDFFSDFPVTSGANTYRYSGGNTQIRVDGNSSDLQILKSN